MTTPRRILVTGASRGLGRALVEHFVAAGDRVIGCSSQPAPADPEGYRHVRADVSSEPEVGQLFAQVREQLGGLDVLVNNAGAASMNPVALMPTARARQVIDVSVLNDTLVEDSETVTVTLTDVSGDPQITLDPEADTATVTIADNDTATVSVVAIDALAAEEGLDSGQFTVSLTQLSSSRSSPPMLRWLNPNLA